MCDEDKRDDGKVVTLVVHVLPHYADQTERLAKLHREPVKLHVVNGGQWQQCQVKRIVFGEKRKRVAKAAYEYVPHVEMRLSSASHRGEEYTGRTCKLIPMQPELFD